MTDARPDPETTEAIRDCERSLPPTAGGDRLVFGFDGYLDRVREVVSERHSPDRYSRLSTLGALGESIADSAEVDASLTQEWRQLDTRAGGHTCHLARAFTTLGYEPVVVGTFGRPPAEQFRTALEGARVHSIGAPGETDAVEFEDGKLLLTELGDTRRIDWETVRDTVGVEVLADRLDGAALLGVGYWAELPNFGSLLDGLREEVWPTLAAPPGHLLVDTGDLRKRDSDDLAGGAAALARLDGPTEVTVSANRPETAVLAPGKGLAPRAAAARERLGVSRFVAHGVERSAAATADGRASVAVPRCEEPALTTSAGDHFNAGLALALVEGLETAPAVALGNAAAGHFVRNGEPPGYETLRSFVGSYLGRF